MRKKKNTLRQPQGSSGFEGLLNIHTAALESNSKEIEKMLKVLSKKDVPKGLQNEIKFIKKELKRLNDEIDNLGED